MKGGRRKRRREEKRAKEQGARVMRGRRRMSDAVCETLGSNKPPANNYNRVGGQKLGGLSQIMRQEEEMVVKSDETKERRKREKKKKMGRAVLPPVVSPSLPPTQKWCLHS